jgi:two-component system phosphate regulon sensor histidine kinase PhoR
MSAERRAVAGFAVVLLLSFAVMLGQSVVGERLRSRHAERADRIAAMQAANTAVLQHLTDAETGVRGFQFTGEPLFLEPYDSGRVAAFGSLDVLESGTGTSGAAETQVRRLLAVERRAAVQWLYGYAIPIVDAGVADTDGRRAARGKEMFDRFRTANADVEAAVDDVRRTQAAAAWRDDRLAQLFFSLLAVLLLGTGLALAVTHQRQLLGPLEHLRQTLRRLAAGDRGARAVPVGQAEMRAVIGALNDLAAETERLLAAEHARAAHGDLRNAVAAELRACGDPAGTGERIVALIGEALGADAGYGRVTVRRGAGVAACWPATAPEFPLDALREIRAGVPGEVLDPVHVPGAMAVPLGGDVDCPPGLLCVVRSGGPDWSPEERRLLAALGRDIDHAVGQQRLRLRQARLISELQALDERKDVFVSTVTHELRTPLTSILGYTEMLADGDGGTLTAAQERGVTAILRNAHRLRDTVGDLMLLNRADGVAGGEPAPVDLAGLAAVLHDDLAASARAKELASTVDGDAAWVHGDAGRLARALRNLMENAIKFTPPGGRIGCRVATGDGTVVVTVTDSGIGIPADDVAGLFTPFHRAANAVHLAVQGNGLGLAIVRAIVGEHGGDVTVHSEVDRGTTVTVTLPAAPVPPR